jgi:hypothetical protein
VLIDSDRLNTWLATPGCVTPDGAATVAAQTWGAYTLEADGHSDLRPTYQKQEDTNTVTAGAVSLRSGAFAGFTWFGTSYTLVLDEHGL